MYVVQLMGGLGNQMFQYAAVKALSIKRNIYFKIDFDDPYIHAKRRYNLDVFKLDALFANKKELNFCKPKTKFIKRWWMLTGRNPSNKLFSEKKEFHFDENFINCPDGSYIRGFWQTEKYFADISDQIRRDFIFRNPPDQLNSRTLSQIQSSNSVSLHIRRGDYVTVQQTNKLHGLCDLEYYNKAVAAIATIEKDPTFFIFSDDILWAKENLSLNFPTKFVDINDNKDHEDLRLMSNCKHNIIANSSFSWWGAWLNVYEKKLVCVPNMWMSNLPVESTDLIPSSWIIIR